MGPHARTMDAGVADQGLEHSLACVDGVNAHVWIYLKQSSGKSTVPIAKHKRRPASADLVEECTPAAPQCVAEGRQLKPTIDTRQAVEVWRLAHRSKQTMGVSKTRSAMQRKVNGVRPGRDRSSQANKRELTAPAAKRSEMRRPTGAQARARITPARPSRLAFGATLA